mmetsp:Transcript_14516/g.43598  ORF Transcript_14516/g.43598 Transcript_14516/m.43598 type:complete len:844 (+) Transcript_14516:997-3528(+)
MEAVRALTPNTRHRDRVRCFQRLARLSRDFTYAVKTYGRIVVSERSLPLHLKTVRPAQVGGVAGGEKYLVRGILFKFAVDQQGLFSSSYLERQRSAFEQQRASSGDRQKLEQLLRSEGDQYAAKVAGHDLKSLTHLFNAWVSDVHFPLLALLDYRGHRLVAMPYLPVSGSGTLCFGSMDAGRTIAQSPEQVVQPLAEIGRRLNLADHFLGASRTRASLPLDLEAHRGSDQRLYLLDFSRTFPPEWPRSFAAWYRRRLQQQLDQQQQLGSALGGELSRASGASSTDATDERNNDKLQNSSVSAEPTIPDSYKVDASSYLYRLLRPEFVKTWKRPLCSDAFSPFLHLQPDAASKEEKLARIEERKQLNQEVSLASQYLLNTRIPEIATTMAKMSPSLLRKMTFNKTIMFLHAHGLNIRYLGFVREQLIDHTFWSFMLLVEMVARVLRDNITYLLRQKVKSHLKPAEGLYCRIVIRRLNLIFGGSAESERYWETSLAPQLQHKYPPDLEFAPALLRQRICSGSSDVADVNALLSPMQRSRSSSPSSSSSSSSLPSSSCSSSSSSSPSAYSGLLVLLARLRQLLGLRFAGNTFACLLATPRLFSYRAPFEETDLSGLKERISYMNIVAHSEGFVLKLNAARSVSDEERSRFLWRAIKKFERALMSNPDNRVTLRNLADCYLAVDEHELAMFYFKFALSLNPKDTNTLMKFATLLDKMGYLVDAQQLYLRSLQAHPLHSNCLCLYADFLWLRLGDLHTADLFYAAAMKADPQNCSAFNNYAVFLMVARAEVSRAMEVFESGMSRLRDEPANPVVYRNGSAVHRANHSLELAAHYSASYQRSQQQRTAV